MTDLEKFRQPSASFLDFLLERNFTKTWQARLAKAIILSVLMSPFFLMGMIGYFKIKENISGRASVQNGLLDYGLVVLNSILIWLILQFFLHARKTQETLILNREKFLMLETELKKKTLELERSNQELEHLAYVASHDLQEPLRMVSSFTKLLADRYKDSIDQDTKEFVGFITDGVSRMKNLITDLLAYSRLSTQQRPFEWTDCEAVLEKVLYDLETQVQENGAVITHDPLPRILVDPGQIFVVFQGLLSNAVKFHGPGVSPCVHIRAAQEQGKWVFSIRDNGVGIASQNFGTGTQFRR